MNPAVFAQLQENLDGCSAELADQWHAILQGAGLASPEDSDTKSQLYDLSEQALMVVSTVPLDSAKIWSLGAALVALGDVQPPIAVSFVDALIQQVSTQLPADQGSTLLQPHLTQFAAELILGFCSAKSAAIKDVNIRAIRKMSHDLKTPINAITGFSKVILKGIDGPITDFQREDLNSVYEAGEQLLNMINDLTEIAKHDEARKELCLDVFDVAALVSDIVTTVQPVMSARDNTLEVRITGELETVEHHFIEMRWSILSLLFFLNHLLEQGTIRVFVTRGFENGVEWLIFHLTGVNLPLEKIQAVVDKDVEVASAYAFCQELGGEIIVEPTTDLNTTFIVRFPVHLDPL